MRLLIDGLPFKSEGYQTARSILLGKFGKSTEIAASRIQCITSPPVIQNSYPNWIHGFYKKLVISVQTLDTMNKLKEINVHVRLTLDKLPGIRTDLVRIAEEWREWTFPQLWRIKKVDYQKSENNFKPWERFQMWKCISNKL